jgi:S1-C subfamily serine protease
MRATFTYLVGSKKGVTEKFDAEVISAGRAPDNMLSFGDEARRVSSHHAEIIRRGDGYLLRDLGSTNGTMINGRRIIVSELRQDDLIEFGAGGPLVRFAIERGGSQGSEASIYQSAKAASGSFKSTGAAINDSGAAHSKKTNAILILAIAAAMLAGALGGVILSSRASRYEATGLSFSAIAEQNSPAVVFIRVHYERVMADGQVLPAQSRTGSGFVISSSGLIVTNRHVVRAWEDNQPIAGQEWRVERIEIFFPQQSRKEAIPAAVEKLTDSQNVDVAILRINAERAPVVRAVEPDLSRVHQGEEVAVMGYPLGAELLDLTKDETVTPSLSTGLVSRVSADFIQLQLRAYRGTSGGPVFNRRGEVIAIVTANVTDAQEITLATPIEAALRLLQNR